MVEPLPVHLPDPEHSHWSPVAERFVTHSHPHAGPHTHHMVGSGHVVTRNQPGNYSPKASR